MPTSLQIKFMELQMCDKVPILRYQYYNELWRRATEMKRSWAACIKCNEQDSIFTVHSSAYAWLICSYTRAWLMAYWIAWTAWCVTVTGKPVDYLQSAYSTRSHATCDSPRYHCCTVLLLFSVVSKCRQHQTTFCTFCISFGNKNLSKMTLPFLVSMHKDGTTLVACWHACQT